MIEATITKQRKSTAKDPAPRFNRDQLPPPSSYYTREVLKLIGRYGDWRSTLCPFHQDKHPSLRINIRTGGFRCMVWDTKGGDVLAFHRLGPGLGFVDAAEALNAWEVSR